MKFSKRTDTIEGHSSRLRVFRLAIAVGLVGSGLGVFAVFGGLGYAASTAKAPVIIVKKIVKPSKATTPSKATKASRQTSHASDAQEKPSQNQYGNKVTICHIPRGNPDNPQTLTLSESGAKAHLREHTAPDWPGDHEGPC
jgi:hypothetical protein